jgi:hypothetical protein
MMPTLTRIYELCTIILIGIIAVEVIGFTLVSAISLIVRTCRDPKMWYPKKMLEERQASSAKVPLHVREKLQTERQERQAYQSD